MRRFQSAFHRGNGCYVIDRLEKLTGSDFQSAFHRGNGCYTNGSITDKFQVVTFSPLFIAALTATVVRSAYKVQSKYFQSAFHRGIECYRICYARVVLILSPSPWDLLSPSLSTQLIAFHRGIECYRICYARVVLILSPSPWDLLSPSLSTQLIAFHRGNGCYLK